MRLYLVNGFLGSGKTTAIHKAVTGLSKQNTRVAVITNDQGEDLVDTWHLRSNQFPTVEVTGGCFCCRYDKLSSAINSLIKDEKARIIFAESVGSCTDLIATVAKPLNEYHPNLDIVISVFAEANLLYALMNNQATFIREEVQYVFKQQLAEADILIINKVDLITEDELALVRAVIKDEYPAKIVLYQNSRNENDINTWLSTLNEFRENKLRKSLDIDCDLYAKGEAALAWLDQRIVVKSTGNQACEASTKLIKNIAERIRAEGLYIGHLKFIMDDGEYQTKISYTSLKDNNEDELVHPARPANVMQVLINARVQCTAGELAAIVSNVINEIIADGAAVETINATSFQPAYPEPKYRMI